MPYSPETEKLIAEHEARRSAGITEIKRLWSKLNSLRGLGNSSKELKDKINDWFQVKDGLDSLEYESMEKVKTSLSNKIDRENK